MPDPDVGLSEPRAHGDGRTVSASLDLPNATWTRVSSRYVIAEFVGLVITAVVLAGATIPLHLLGLFFAPWVTAAVVVAVLVFAGFTPRRVRSIGYQLREDDLVFRRGILYQRVVAVPYGRMQLVDIIRGPLARALGLSELKFVTAAATSGVVIPGLPAADAELLRDRLVELAESRRAGL